jgi:hypothetical protein
MTAGARHMIALIVILALLIMVGTLWGLQYKRALRKVEEESAGAGEEKVRGEGRKKGRKEGREGGREGRGREGVPSR